MSGYAAAIGGGLVNGAFGIISNELARQREAEARLENYKYGELAANSADARTRALYENYQSPEALLRQYKEAGLSPSLMFSGGAAGAGGMTQGAQGAGAAGVNPNVFGINVMEGAQLGLMQAQARKTNAEADTLEAKNDRGKLELENLQENINNTIAKTHNEGLKSAWYEYENALQSLRVGYEASTFDTKIETYLKELDYLKYKTRSAAVKAEIDENTQKDIERLAKENVRNVIVDTILKRADAELKKESKKLVGQEIILTKKQVEDLISQIETRGKQVQINRDTLNQEIKEWALKNGLVFDGEGAKWHQVLERTIYGEKGQEFMVRLIEAMLN